MKSMKRPNDSECNGFSEAFYGSSTIGERGQIVIPAEARADLGFQPGDKVIIMRHPVHKGIVLFKMEAVREFLDDFQRNLDRIDGMKSEEDH